MAKKQKHRRPSLACKKCGSTSNEVIRVDPSPEMIRRHRKCLGCGHLRVTTEVDPKDTGINDLHTGIICLAELSKATFATARPR